MESQMSEIRAMFKSIHDQIQKVDEKIEKSQSKIEKIEAENEELKKIVEDQKQQIEILQKQNINRNLIIYGIEDEDNENQYTRIQKIEQLCQNMQVKLNTNTDISDSSRLGKYCDNKVRPMQLVLTTKIKKTELLKNSYRLKATQYWISDEYTKQEQDERKQLKEHLQEARGNGHNAKLRRNKLIINGKSYTIEMLNKHKKNQEKKHLTKRTTSQRSPETAEERPDKRANKEIIETEEISDEEEEIQEQTKETQKNVIVKKTVQQLLAPYKQIQQTK